MKRRSLLLAVATCLFAGLVACGDSGNNDTNTERFEELVEAMGEVFIDPSAAESPYLRQEACLMEVLVNDGLTTWDWAINYYRSNYKTVVDWNEGRNFPPENIYEDNPDYDWDQFLSSALPCLEQRVFPLSSDSDDERASDQEGPNANSARDDLINLIRELGLEDDIEVVECIVDLVTDMSGLSYSEIEEMLRTQSPELEAYGERIDQGCFRDSYSEIELGEVFAPNFEIMSQHPSNECLNEGFDKFVNVFGIYVAGVPEASNAFVLHTANVLAQYIDNDEDGDPDDPEVLRVLVRGNYIVPVWTELDRESLWNRIQGRPCVDDIGMTASMYIDEDEWAFGGIAATGSWDTNLEEVWHVVSIGWYEAHPEYFGDTSRSRLGEAMDAARGGRFESIPSSYPEGSWYNYYDYTCDYYCQIHEYFYWILMANIGALDPSLTDKCEDSRDEWYVCTKAKLGEVDEIAYDLLNNRGFRLPTRIPTGSYLSD